MIVRLAEPRDLGRIAEIYNEGIDGRVATFETTHRTADDLALLLGERHLLIVAEQAGSVIGVGRALMDHLARRGPERGVHKLVGKVLTTNEASLGLLRACGFREVGVHHRHGRLDGEWRDVTVVERLLT